MYNFSHFSNCMCTLSIVENCTETLFQHNIVTLCQNLFMALGPLCTLCNWKWIFSDSNCGPLILESTTRHHDPSIGNFIMQALKSMWALIYWVPPLNVWMPFAWRTLVAGDEQLRSSPMGPVWLFISFSMSYEVSCRPDDNRTKLRFVIRHKSSVNCKHICITISCC